MNWIHEFDIRDAFAVVGTLSLTAGVAVLHWPTALIVLGLVLLAAWFAPWFGGLRRGPSR